MRSVAADREDASEMIARLRGRMIVSCQAYPGEPLQFPEAMLGMALAAQRGGAGGIRAQGLADIRLIARSCALPLIGLVKVPGDPVFITPTIADALAVAGAGADIVAVDGTRRSRPDGASLQQVTQALHDACGVAVMADCGSLDDGKAAQEAGVDIIGTTLSGYTDERAGFPVPDIDLIADMVSTLTKPVFAEGRIHSPAQAREALDAGAASVVVGTAITHPTTLTSWYVDALTASES